MKGWASYEHQSEPLLARPLFLRRMVEHLVLAFIVLFVSLGIGVLGYHYTAGLPWIDSLMNASMILGGMGPVDLLHTTGGKLFASAYALFSGVAFLVTIGVIVAPLAHRLLHGLHLDSTDPS
jgi:hypothetical protein